MHLYPIGGAVHDVDREHTAFSYRDVHWSMVIAGIDPEPDRRNVVPDWARSYWQDIHPRLREVKAKYDPSSFFRINQNIEPA